MHLGLLIRAGKVSSLMITQRMINAPYKAKKKNLVTRPGSLTTEGGCPVLLNYFPGLLMLLFSCSKMTATFLFFAFNLVTPRPGTVDPMLVSAPSIKI